MFLNRIVLCLILSLVLCVVESGHVFGRHHREYLREGDECIDEETGQAGLCTPVNYCRSIYGNVKYYTENSTTCWYGNGALILCCPDQEIIWDPPKERAISQKMCLEYSKSVALWVVDTGSPQSTSLPTSSPSPNPTLSFSDSYRARRSADGVQIVYGGVRTKPHEFPHMAALGWLTKSGQHDFKCGGTLVSPLFVLTAGHCTKAPSQFTELTSEEPTVIRLGADELHQESSNRVEPPEKSVTRYIRETASLAFFRPGGNDRRTENPDHLEGLYGSVRRIVRHPAYKPPAVYNDIALVEMAVPVDLNSFVRPACLWHKEDFGGINQATVTGWGATSRSSPRSNVLLKADLLLFSNTFCQPRLEHLRNRKWRNGLSPEQMCAGDLLREHDSCRGDSGGPLQVKLLPEPYIHYVVGITSFGDSCPAGSGAGVYTRVSSFIPWIESIVWPDQVASRLNQTSGDF